MQVLLFFNELSAGSDRPRSEAEELAISLVEAARAVASRRPGAALIAPDLARLPIVKDYTFGEWWSRADNRTRKQLIQNLRQKAPFTEPLSSEETEVDYLYGQDQSRGLGWADLHDGLAVSLPSDDCWRVDHVPVTRQRLAVADDDVVSVFEDAVEVRHAAEAGQVDGHLDWITTTSILDARTGQELWDGRTDFFPHLRFVRRTEAQVCRLRSDWVLPVARELAAINRAAHEWDPATQHAPLWRTKMSPESASRIQQGLVDLPDDDGTIRTFSQHGRFTPGPGRVHFLLDAENHKVVIGHVGSKLF